MGFLVASMILSFFLFSQGKADTIIVNGSSGRIPQGSTIPTGKTTWVIQTPKDQVSLEFDEFNLPSSDGYSTTFKYNGIDFHGIYTNQQIPLVRSFDYNLIVELNAPIVDNTTQFNATFEQKSITMKERNVTRSLQYLSQPFKYHVTPGEDYSEIVHLRFDESTQVTKHPIFLSGLMAFDYPNYMQIYTYSSTGTEATTTNWYAGNNGFGQYVNTPDVYLLFQYSKSSGQIGNNDHVTINFISPLIPPTPTPTTSTPAPPPTTTTTTVLPTTSTPNSTSPIVSPESITPSSNTTVQTSTSGTTTNHTMPSTSSTSSPSTTTSQQGGNEDTTTTEAPKSAGRFSLSIISFALMMFLTSILR